MPDKFDGTGDGSSSEKEKKLDQTTSIKIPPVFISGLIKMIFPSLMTIAITVMGYYLNANYVPRKEMEEKYIKKYEHEQLLKEVEVMKLKMVDRELYDAKIAYITQSLERIEKSLEENNKDFREILRSLPKNNS